MKQKGSKSYWLLLSLGGRTSGKKGQNHVIP
jgi:hypothetical protein